MNSVKNAIVTMTLLAVGYGAYVVLTNPVPDDLGELADASIWEAPEVTTTSIDESAATSLTSMDQPPPLDDADYPSTLDSASNAQIPVGSSDPYPPSAPDAPLDAYETTSANSAGSSPALSHPGGAAPPLDHPHGHTSHDESLSLQASDTNFYLNPSGSELPGRDAYPQTDASDLPLPAPNGNAEPDSSGYSNDLGGTHNGDDSEFGSAWRTAQENLRRGELAEALATLSVWRDDPLVTAQQQEPLQTLLDQLAGTVIYSRDSYLEPAHVVQRGDRLEDLAQRFQVPVEFLARINGIEAPYEVFPGESIKVVRGPFRAEVSRGRGDITLFLGQHYAGRFVARIGAELPQGETTYDVVSTDPGLEYFDPATGDRIEREDPRNPYGEIWINLRGHHASAHDKVGIHVDRGDPQRCCIAVSAVDANDLAAIIGPRSTVLIKD